MPYGLGSVRGVVAVVTGAASGIGRATARALAAKGAALGLADIDELGLARVVDELRKGGTKVTARNTNVAEEAEVQAFAQAVEASLGPVELLVNCAGLVVIGDFLATSSDDLALLFDVNVKGAAYACRACAPGMVKRGRGQIVNVASAAAFTTPGGLAAYGATKHALRGFSDGLRDELAEHGVGVAVVCPGFVDTRIVEHARVRADADVDIEAERRRMASFLRGRGLSAERVAARIVRAAERGETLIPVGIEAHVLYALSRFAPRVVPALFGAVRRRVARQRRGD